MIKRQDKLKLKIVINTSVKDILQEIVDKGYYENDYTKGYMVMRDLLWHYLKLIKENNIKLVGVENGKK